MTRILRGAEYPEALQQALAAGPADKFAWMDEHTRVLKRDAFSCVGLLQLQGRHCYLKLYRAKGLLQGLGFRLGRCRAVASFDNAARLLDAGIPVPAPLGCLLCGGDVFLLTAGIDGSRDLKSLWVQGQTDARLDELMQLAGSSLAALHAAGFCHGDCKWSNFLVADQRVYLVDLEAVGRTRGESPNCLRDLARFTVNAEDMGLAPDHYATFIDSYTAGLGQDREHVVSRLRPDLAKLRQRHLQKYGERGHRLL